MGKYIDIYARKYPVIVTRASLMVTREYKYDPNDIIKEGTVCAQGHTYEVTNKYAEALNAAMSGAHVRSVDKEVDKRIMNEKVTSAISIVELADLTDEGVSIEFANLHELELLHTDIEIFIANGWRQMQMSLHGDPKDFEKCRKVVGPIKQNLDWYIEQARLKNSHERPKWLSNAFNMGGVTRSRANGEGEEAPKRTMNPGAPKGMSIGNKRTLNF